MAKRFDRNPKLTYPPECKELNEELSKDELVKRLKVGPADLFYEFLSEMNGDMYVCLYCLLKALHCIT